MNKKIKKMIAIGLSVALIFSSTVPAFAHSTTIEENNTPRVMLLDADEIDTSIPTELIGMDRFLSLASDGTIQLDVSGALAAGYQEKYVLGVKGHLDGINEQVLDGEMSVDPTTFTAYSVNTMAARSVSNNVTFDAGFGYTGVRSEWYGATFIYFNNVQDKVVYRGFFNAYESCDSLIANLNKLKMDNDLISQGGLDAATQQKYTNYAEKAIDLIISGAFIVGYTSLIYAYLIENAMAAGKGIIWLITNDYNTGNVGWAFDAQSW